MDPAMEARLPYEDEAALSHRSRPLTLDIIQASELVLTMEFAHHMRILDRWPEEADRVFGLYQFVEGLEQGQLSGVTAARIEQVRRAVRSNSMMWDIDDPYRRGDRAARACAIQLDDLVRRLGLGLGLQPTTEG